MPVKQWECPPDYVNGASHASDFPATPLRTERRSRARAQVHWPVILVRSDEADTVETTTQNLTSDGFYCLSPSPFVPGERLNCCLKVPPHDPAGRNQVLWLECCVRVARVDPANAERGFGIAFQIENYRFACRTA
jgi:hypothetical protein